MYAINGRTSGLLPLGVVTLKWAIPTPPPRVEYLKKSLDMGPILHEKITSDG